MRIYYLIGLLCVFSTVKCDLLEGDFFFHILSNVVLPELDSFDYIGKIRFGVTITNSAYEALAPYLTQSMGVYSKIPRRPIEERTKRNKNIALGYASIRVISSLLSSSAVEKLHGIFRTAGLDPEDETLDLNTPIGIGNYVARVVLQERETDGMNQFGNLNGKSYNLMPYEDYTMFKPKNTAYDLDYPCNWQPDIVKVANLTGVYAVQHHAFPQYQFVKTISSIDINNYTTPIDHCDPSNDMEMYKKKVDEILKESRELNDYKKMSVEHFNDKIVSLLQPTLFLAEKHGLDQDEIIILDFLTHMALFDAGIVIWKEKLKHNSVRPFSAVRYIYDNVEIEAWGGPGVGTIKNMTGREWIPYIQTAPYAEYPSAIACFCTAQFVVLEKYFESDEFGYSVVKQQGSSIIEAGKTPAVNVTLGPYKKFSDYVDECGNSRVWGGVHFRDSIEEGKRLCKQVAIDVYNFAIKLIGKKH